MLILDTDHLVEYQKGTSAAARRLKQKLNESAQPFATTIITVEELIRGWLAHIRRANDPFQQIPAYTRLRQLFRFFASWNIADWTDAAATKFTELKASKVRVGTMDLKVASIVLANDATLLTRNSVDFARVPQLKTLDWLS